MAADVRTNEMELRIAAVRNSVDLLPKVTEQREKEGVDYAMMFAMQVSFMQGVQWYVMKLREPQKR